MAKGSVIKTLLAGVAGGAIALSGGAAYEAINGNHLTNTTQATTNSSTTGDIKQVSVNVTSDTTNAVATIKNAVVSVLNYQGTTSTSASQLTDQNLVSEGSGVIYKKANGKAYIVTNDHVIAGASALEVLLATGQKVTATVVGSDTYSDLAVLTISDQYVTTTATFADSSKLNVGEPAIAVGSPLGSSFANTATEGIVSSLSRTVTLTNNQDQVVSTPNAIQTDAAINPGNSGGALININGQVIGITSSKISATPDGTANSSGVTVEGMGFAIPSNEVIQIISQLEKTGKVVRPALGVSGVDLASVSSYALSQYKVPSSVTAGAMIADVFPGMPAAGAGLKVGDVVTKMDNTTISSMTDLTTNLMNHSVGDTIKLTYYRDGQEATVSVKLTSTSSQLPTQSNNSNNSNNANNPIFGN